MKKQLLTAAVLFSFMMMSFAVTAQDMVNYTWSTYKTKFSVPSTFTVEQNDATAFSAGDNDMNLTIYPKSGENLSYPKMKSALLEWANSNNVTNMGEVTLQESINGYWGVYVEGDSNNFPVFLMLAVDPDYPELSLYIWISYREAKVDTAVDILLSFTPN